MAIYNGDHELRELLRLCGVEDCAFRGEVQKKFREIKNRAVRVAIATMVDDMYDDNIAKIQTDIARVAVADWGEDVRPEPGERRKLLRILFWIFGVYFDGDYGALIEQCKSQAVFTSYPSGCTLVDSRL